MHKLQWSQETCGSWSFNAWRWTTVYMKETNGGRRNPNVYSEWDWQTAADLPPENQKRDQELKALGIMEGMDVKTEDMITSIQGPVRTPKSYSPLSEARQLPHSHHCRRLRVLFSGESKVQTWEHWSVLKTQIFILNAEISQEEDSKIFLWRN